ncbi:hypothetical protein P280DRAFT_482363 [Massarina eburnea CBS 473.64]|uniref:Uncharacterized protein n=1 Tax=Massarina eburnea CBS 473.64 TaxID=1395130 RepID=A0A6A6RTB9_9PLEO|nr:hypothetical protein P280DRAFT_482363 [Massarina eburnea CBS 473.64]
MRDFYHGLTIFLFATAVICAPKGRSYRVRTDSPDVPVHYLPPNATYTKTLARRYANITRHYPNITICGESSIFSLNLSHPGKAHRVPLLGFGKCTRLDDSSDYYNQSDPIDKVEISNDACTCKFYTTKRNCDIGRNEDNVNTTGEKTLKEFNSRWGVCNVAGVEKYEFGISDVFVLLAVTMGFL